MDETTPNTEFKDAGARHAQFVRDNVEEVIDVVQQSATQLSDYVASFVSTLFGGTK